MSDVKPDWVFAQSHLPKSVLTGELPLYETKWWDHKLLDPTSATMEFVANYYLQRCHYYRQYKDVATGDAMLADLAANKPGLLGLNKSDQIGAWYARRAADARGIPYEFYISQYMDLCERFGFKDCPTLSELYKNSIVERVEEAWKAYNTFFVKRPETAFYRNKSTRNHPYAQQWRRHLFDRNSVMSGSAWVGQVAVLTTVDDLLYEEVLGWIDPDYKEAYVRAFNTLTTEEVQ